MTPAQYAKLLKDWGLDKNYDISPEQFAAIFPILSSDQFIKIAMKIFNQNIATGGENGTLIRVYAGIGFGPDMRVIHADQGCNGSSTCTGNLPPILTDDGQLLFEWHAHPFGTALPSPPDLLTSVRDNTPGVIWYNADGEGHPQTTFYQGHCLPAEPCGLMGP
jgi:hypothetical protein